MANHAHREGGYPCRYRTKRECDEVMTQFNHGHLGRECIKDFQPSKSKRGKMNATATCTIIQQPESGLSFAGSLEAQMSRAPQSWHDDLESWRHAQEVQ